METCHRCRHNREHNINYRSKYVFNVSTLAFLSSLWGELMEFRIFSLSYGFSRMKDEHNFPPLFHTRGRRASSSHAKKSEIILLWFSFIFSFHIKFRFRVSHAMGNSLASAQREVCFSVSENEESEKSFARKWTVRVTESCAYVHCQGFWLDGISNNFSENVNEKLERELANERRRRKWRKMPRRIINLDENGFHPLQSSDSKAEDLGKNPRNIRSIHSSCLTSHLCAAIFVSSSE